MVARRTPKAEGKGPSQTERLRRDALDLAREVRAIELLTRFDTHSARKSARQFRKLQEQIGNLAKSQLRVLIRELRETVRRYREIYHPKVSASKLVALLDEVEAAPIPISYIKKSSLTRLFDCEKWFTNLKVVPGHIGIAINPID